jgi:hypothetical protein
MASIHPEFTQIPDALHDALLTIPGTKALCATEMIGTHPLTLSQTQVETGIDRIITDLTDQLVLSIADYAALLAKHQVVPAPAALRELRVSGKMMLLEHEKALTETLISAAAAEWTGLSQAQKDAIPSIKAAGDEGIDTMNGRLYWLNDQITQLNLQRNLGF